MRVPIYKNSFLASLCSFVGTMLWGSGLYLSINCLFEGIYEALLVGIILIPLGLFFVYIGAIIAELKLEKRILKHIQQEQEKLIASGHQGLDMDEVASILAGAGRKQQQVAACPHCGSRLITQRGICRKCGAKNC